MKRSQNRQLRSLCVLLTRLGDGWIYLAVGVPLFILRGWAAHRPALAASVAAGLGQLTYAFLKPRLARIRPCEADPAMDLSVRTLDRFSCPSGHCLTVTAVGIPLGWAYPHTITIIFLLILLIGLARVGLGHHYPTDVLLGVLLGAILSLPISALLL
jgi:undecaprenyl-diphosphatase